MSENEIEKILDRLGKLEVAQAKQETTMKIGGAMLGFLAAVIGPVITALIVVQMGVR